MKKLFLKWLLWRATAKIEKVILQHTGIGWGGEPLRELRDLRQKRQELVNKLEGLKYK